MDDDTVKESSYPFEIVRLCEDDDDDCSNEDDDGVGDSMMSEAHSCRSASTYRMDTSETRPQGEVRTLGIPAPTPFK